MEAAKQKFQETVAKTQEPGDAKGPPGGELRTTQPSKDDASISNTFTTRDRTANSHTTEDQNQSTRSDLSFSTNFFNLAAQHVRSVIDWYI